MSTSLQGVFGRFHKDRYEQNTPLNRGSYIQNVHRLAQSREYDFFSPLSDTNIKHLDRQFTVNFYFKDWVRVMNHFRDFYGKGTLYVVSGFRSPFELGVNAHSAGLAIDLLVEDTEQADRVMNAAYMAGVPTIIPVGRLSEGQGHIHLDLAPPPPYAYDSGSYTGPWEGTR